MWLWTSIKPGATASPLAWRTVNSARRRDLAYEGDRIADDPDVGDRARIPLAVNDEPILDDEVIGSFRSAPLEKYPASPCRREAGLFQKIPSGDSNHRFVSLPVNLEGEPASLPASPSSRNSLP